MAPKPVRLTEKYRPHRIDDFVGHDKIKAVLSKFIKNPYPNAFLFSGSSGIAKTAMAIAMAEEVGARRISLGARQANHATIEKLCEEIERDSQYVWNDISPCNFNRDGVQYRSRLFFVIIDEVDQVPETVSYLLLNKLDSSQEVPHTVWIFTCNSTKNLEKRFLSRCIQLEFSTYGMSQEIVDFLKKVWNAERGTEGMPDWERIVKEKGNNVRDCLQYMEAELLARS